MTIGRGSGDGVEVAGQDCWVAVAGWMGEPFGASQRLGLYQPFPTAQSEMRVEDLEFDQRQVEFDPDGSSRLAHRRQGSGLDQS